MSFAALVEAIARSVAQAQDEVERHQVQNLLDYFDSNGRPRGIEFRVPSVRSDAKFGDEDFYSVPLLALVSINVLKIEDVKIDFAMDLGEMTEDAAPASPQAAPIDPAAKHAAPQGFVSGMKTLNVSTTTGRRGGQVQVSLRVKGSEPSEGAARLLDYLAQIQGVYREPEEGESSA
ncbi:MAG TPA: DUF2589 domain-containing protein [Longimicrobiales bacterium]|nr:DUF2589 domain-containing protein [Longimicrobiales bacterium]